MQDLKTGFMVGGRPVKQQMVQFGVTWIGALMAIGAIYLLWSNGPNGQDFGGFGEGTSLPAPQAGAPACGAGNEVPSPKPPKS